MRLYSDVEETSKTIVVEDYSTFKNLLKSKWLFYLLIGYTVYIPLNAALAFLDGGLIMAIVNVIVHGLICASMWMFRKANINNENEKFDLKATKLFQVAHAVKYVIVFLICVLVILLIFFGMLGALNEARAENFSVKAGIFFDYIGILVLFIAFMVATCVYYKAVMKVVDSMTIYHTKGTHFWNDIKFLAIYLFVTAGLLVVLGGMSAFGIFDSMQAKIGDTNFTAFAGGLGLYSFIGRVVFALLCVGMGIVCLKGYKILSTTETSHEEIVEITEEE